MKHQLSRTIALTAALCGALVSGACHYSRAAARTPGAPAPDDPPERAARLSYRDGAVSFRTTESEWTPAVPNRPLTTGDEVWTSSNARAEIHVGSTALRLDANTYVRLLEVSGAAIQVRLDEGTASVHVRDLEEGEEVEVATPRAAVSVQRAGRYRVTVSTGGESVTAIARTGGAEVTGDGFAVLLHAGQRLHTPSSGATHAVDAAPPGDAFDQFSATREAREDKALAARHVSSGVIGYEDLDGHGDWRPHPRWGSIWIPRTPAGWAPYRHGHWVWVSPWGWTWIDDAPWGFAPFHYGRWIYVDGHWVWIPGPYHRRPVWAPALVVFAGGPGFQFHVRAGGGLGVAWFPLGPSEVWIPPYRASRRYVTHVNVTHTVIVNHTTIHNVNVQRQRYVNHSVEGAVTAMPRDRFGRAEPVSQHAVRLSREETRTLRPNGMGAPVEYTRERVVRPGGSVAAQPPNRPSRPDVVVHRTPTAPRTTTPRTASPEYRPAPPHREPAPPRATPRRDPPSASEQRRERQWERKSTREQESRRQTVEKERRTAPAQGRQPAEGGTRRGAEPGGRESRR